MRKNLPVSAFFCTFAADFIKKLAGNGIYIRHTVFRGLLRQGQIVEHFEDVKVKIVDNFEDIKIKIVEHFEGVKK